MAGHSQFKNIMHRKGRQDAVKSKLFGKLAREITVSAKMGSPDPGMNARLRAAIIAATADAMLEAAIEAGAEDVVSGEGGHEIYTTPDQLAAVGKAMEAKFGEPR